MIESWVDFALSVIGGATAFLCLFDGTRRLFAFGVHRRAVVMTVLAAGICALYGGFAYWKYSDLKATLSMSQRKATAAQPANWGRLSPERQEAASLARARWLAARHPGTPWYAKLLVAGIVAYALSPIDLIPDFVPVLGYLDDLILIPLGIALAIRMIPGPILEECRAQAQERMASARPVSRFAALVIVGVWLAAAALCALWAYRTWFSS